MDQVKLAKRLGWMGISLGLTEMLAPEWLARQIGVTTTGPRSCARWAPARR